MRIALLIAMNVAGLMPHVHGFTHRFALVDGADYVIVGERMFAGYVRTHACTTVQRKVYRRERVVVHICNI